MEGKITPNIFDNALEELLGGSDITSQTSGDSPEKYIERELAKLSQDQLLINHLPVKNQRQLIDLNKIFNKETAAEKFQVELHKFLRPVKY